MKRTDWIILIIVILLIVAIGIWAYTSEEAKNTKGGRLQALNDRISKINKQIDDEMKSLKLTTEMKKFVDKRISQWLWVVKIFLLAILGSIYSAFFFNSNGWLNSLFMTSGLVGIVLTFVPILLVSKTIDTNTVIRITKDWINYWVSKKYGYDPSLAENLQESISIKKEELGNLNEELKTVRVNADNN